MKKLLFIIGCLVILFSLAYACDYEGVLCGSAGNEDNASADTSGAKGKN